MVPVARVERVRGFLAALQGLHARSDPEGWGRCWDLKVPEQAAIPLVVPPLAVLTWRYPSMPCG